MDQDKQFEEYKKKNEHLRLEVAKLTDKRNVLKEENLQLTTQKDDLLAKQEQELTDHENIKSLLKDGLDDGIEKLKMLKLHQEYEYESLRSENERNYEELLNNVKDHERVNQGDLRELDQALQVINLKLEQTHERVLEKEELERERTRLRQELQYEKKQKQKELADKEREKVQATNKLQNDMKKKVEETKDNLKALKQEQIATTTRLTVLQNHQLTTELEYQSKQTEKLIAKNHKLEITIFELRRNVDIHKEVEKGLAQRTLACQQFIKKQSQKIKELEERNEYIKKSLDIPFDKQDSKNRIDIDDGKNDEIIMQLQQIIENSEKKLAQKQNLVEILQSENMYMEKKLDEKESGKQLNLSIIIANYFDTFLQNRSSIESFEQVDLGSLRSKNLKEWTIEEKNNILNILIDYIRPNLTKKNLSSHNDSKMINIISAEYYQRNVQGDDFSLPKLTETSQNDQRNPNSSKRFQDVPLDLSTKIVKSNLREWGKVSSSLPASNSNKSMNRRFNVN